MGGANMGDARDGNAGGLPDCMKMGFSKWSTVCSSCAISGEVMYTAHQPLLWGKDQNTLCSYLPGIGFGHPHQSKTGTPPTNLHAADNMHPRFVSLRTRTGSLLLSIVHGIVHRVIVGRISLTVQSSRQHTLMYCDHLIHLHSLLQITLETNLSPLCILLASKEQLAHAQDMLWHLLKVHLSWHLIESRVKVHQTHGFED
jgi:hypothetical protein